MIRARASLHAAVLWAAACVSPAPSDTDPTDTAAPDIDSDDTDTDDTDPDDTDAHDTGDTDTDEPLDEEAWRRTAGPATIDAGTEAPFATFRDDLDLETLADASRGRELFVGRWEPAGGRETLDGLGPLFIADRCAGCHPATGRPLALAEAGRVDVGLLVRVALAGSTAPDPFVGPQLQTDAVEGVPLEASLSWTYEDARTWRLAGGEEVLLRRVLVEPTFGAHVPHEEARFSPRLSPHLVGIGLLDVVPDESIEALEDLDDADRDGVSGRAARLPDGLGRFGWKAIHASARSQTAGAFSQDMGIGSPSHPDPVCTPTQLACLAAAGDDIEVSDAGLDQVDAYLAALGVPARRLPDGLDPRRGEALFRAIGCDSCHHPTLTTATEGVPEHLAGITLHAWTDLLLHDMGNDLAARVGEGDASPAEWRTPPLWGLGLSAVQPSHRYLHDGRAGTLVEAIGWHGGEAGASRDAFAALEPSEREALLDFLEAL